jgi:hypothetical protein
MSPQDWLIVAAAVIDVIALLALVIVGLRFKALASESQQMARPLIERGRRIAGTGRELVVTGKSRGDAMRHVVQTLMSHVNARVRTTRRIVAEVAHPDTSTLGGVTHSLEQGRAWADRLSRLGAAAQRAAGSNGHDRHP